MIPRNLCDKCSNFMKIDYSNEPKLKCENCNEQELNYKSVTEKALFTSF